LDAIESFAQAKRLACLVQINKGIQAAQAAYDIVGDLDVVF
jgi:hypothetical protein